MSHTALRGNHKRRAKASAGLSGPWQLHVVVCTARQGQQNLVQEPTANDRRIESWPAK